VALLRSKPILDGQSGYAKKVSDVVGDARHADGDRLRRDQRIHASDLLPGLAQVSLDHERLASSRRVKCDDPHQLEVRFESYTFYTSLARAGDSGPDLNRSERGDCQGTPRGRGYTISNILVTCFRLQERFDNARVEQVLHRLK